LESRFRKTNFFSFLSTSFQKRAPSKESWLHTIVSKDVSASELLNCANSSYPILPENVLPLIQDFLQVAKNKLDSYQLPVQNIEVQIFLPKKLDHHLYPLWQKAVKVINVN
jgi:hypothetical protein